MVIGSCAFHTTGKFTFNPHGAETVLVHYDSSDLEFEMSNHSMSHGEDVTLSWGDNGRHAWLVTLAFCAFGVALSAAGVLTL